MEKISLEKVIKDFVNDKIAQIQIKKHGHWKTIWKDKLT